MAIGIHVARVAFVKVDGTGNVLSKEDPSVTLKQQMTGSHDHRIIVDSAIPNSVGNPTMKAYLEAEANDDYVANHVSQNLIVTYSVPDMNAV